MRSAKNSLIILIGLLVLFAAPAHLVAEDVRVTTVFDKRSVVLGEDIQLTIKITGTQSNLMRPRLPGLPGFDSYYTGRTNNFTFINGRSETTTTFSYILSPKRVGSVNMPPIEVQVDDKVFKTDPIQLNVSAPGGAAGSTSAQQVPQTPVNRPAGSQSATGTSNQQLPTMQPPTIPVETGGRDIFLRVAADKREAYPNEQVILNYSVYTRLSARAEQFEKDPNFNGFWVEDIPIERDYQPQKVILGGLQYLKADVKRLALFPTTTGQFETDPGVYRVTVKQESRPSSLFDDFFDESFFGGSLFARRETKLLTVEPTSITVRPLPTQDKPVDFSGMVGQFKLSAVIDKRVVKENEPVMLTITLEGEGNVEVLERPAIPEMENVKVYDTDSSVQIFRTLQGISGRKIFEVSFIPTQAGTFEIPALKFAYFDLREKRYITRQTPIQQINVNPGPKTAMPFMTGERGGELKKTVEVESRDIRFIRESYGTGNNKAVLKLVTRILFVFNALLSVLAGGLFARSQFEARFGRNEALIRRRLASRNLQKAMKDLKKLCRAQRAEQQALFFESAPRAMNQYLADRFNLSAQGITLPEVEKLLLEHGFDAAKLAQVQEFYDTCDRVRFTSAEVPSERKKECVQVINAVSAHLEKVK